MRWLPILSSLKDKLDEDCKRRMYTNPLRVLDSKNPQVQALLNDAPALGDYLDEDSKAHFAGLCALLDDAGIRYTVNQRLVRGLDYYITVPCLSGSPPASVPRERSVPAVVMMVW